MSKNRTTLVLLIFLFVLFSIALIYLMWPYNHLLFPKTQNIRQLGKILLLYQNKEWYISMLPSGLTIQCVVIPSVTIAGEALPAGNVFIDTSRAGVPAPIGSQVPGVKLTPYLSFQSGPVNVRGRDMMSIGRFHWLSINDSSIYQETCQK